MSRYSAILFLLIVWSLPCSACEKTQDYYPSGQKHFVYNLDSQCSGQVTEYATNGQAKSRWNYHQGIISESIHYDKEGSIRYQYHPNTALLTGSVEKYRTDGTLAASWTYKNGVLEGPTKRYDQQGKTAQVFNYHSGVYLREPSFSWRPPFFLIFIPALLVFFLLLLKKK